MSTNSNTGHAINVANFEILVADITSLGATYNPSKESLTLAALNPQLEAAKQALADLHAAEPAYRIAVDNREAAFKPFNKLISRVHLAVKVSDVSSEFEATVMTLIRLLKGRRAKAITEDSEATHVSASHMGYDERIENFDKLIKLLASVPAYAPNEPDLKVTALTELYNEFVTLNTAVFTTEIPFNNARIQRNEILYTQNTGLVAVGNDVKLYIRSVFGNGSPQYNAIKNLKFTYQR